VNKEIFAPFIPILIFGLNPKKEKELTIYLSL